MIIRKVIKHIAVIAIAVPAKITATVSTVFRILSILRLAFLVITTPIGFMGVRRAD